MGYMAHEVDALGGCVGMGGWGNLCALVFFVGGFALLAYAVRLAFGSRAKAADKVCRYLRLLFLACLIPASAARAAAPGGEERFTAVVALQYRVSGAKIAALRAKGTAWYDIAQAVVLADKTGKPMKVVLWLKESGLSWADISLKFGLDPDQVSAEARDLSRLAPD